MSNPLQRWFNRARVRIAPVQTNGREASFTDGCSLLELARAGMTEAEAKALGVPVDRTRTSAVGSNVMQLERVRKVNCR